jgi:hypothetical protein
VKSLAIILGVVAIAGAGTYAWQLQQETISGITYSAGSADLKIDSDPSSTNQTWVDSFDTGTTADLSGLKPGSSGSQIVDIQSQGDPNGTASIRLDLTANDENIRLTPETQAGDNTDGPGELDANMRVKISYDPTNTGTFSQLYDYTLAEYEANPSLLTLGAISNTNGIASVKLEWSIPGDASNQIMTDSVEINVIFGLE